MTAHYHHRFNELSADLMRQRGSLKWTGTANTPIRGHWVAEMDFGTSPAVAETLQKAITDGLLGYTPHWATEAACAATCAYYQEQFHWDIGQAQITLVASVLDGLRATMRTMIPTGSTVLVPTPAYMPFLTMPQAFGHQVKEIPSLLVNGQWELDFDALESAASTAHMLILCNPWNPTGRVLKETELRRLEAIATQHNLLVFSDEIHSPLVYAPNQHRPYASLSPATAAHTVTAVSASKGYNIAGLQCAQIIVADPQLRQRWLAAATSAAHPGTLGVLAVPAAYQHSQNWSEEIRQYLASNIQLVDQMLTDSPLAWTAPQATYLAWIDASALGATPAKRILAETGIQVNCGSTLGNGYEQYLRFNFASSQEVVGESLERILALAR